MTISISTTRKIFLFTLYGVLACFGVWWILMLLTPSPNIAGIENNTIYFVQRILEGSSLYADPENPPFAIAQYNPLYYQVVAGAARLTGTGPDDVIQLFLVNRCVSLALLLSVSFSVAGIGRKVFDLPVLHAVIKGGIVFVFMGVTSFARADSLALALYFPSLLLFLSALSADGSQKKQWLWAGILAGLAFWAKQPAILLFLICIGWLVWKKRWPSLLPYLSGFGVVVLGGLIVIHSTSGLDIYYKNVVRGIDNGFDLHSYFNVIVGMFLAKAGLPWFLLMGVVIVLLRKTNKEKLNFLSALIIFQFLFSMIGSSRTGASSNYFAEWWILVLLGTAACWPLLSGILRAFDPRIIYVSAIIVLLWRLSTIVYPVTTLASAASRDKGVKLFQVESELATKIKSETDGRSHFIFNNIFSPDSYLNNLLFREAVIPQNDIVTFGTWDRKVFDYSAFLQQIANGSIRLIVMKKSETPAMHLAIPMDQYKPVDSIGEYILFRHMQYEARGHEK